MNQIPTEAPNPSLDGVLHWSCCGHAQRTQGSKLETVCCPLCNNLFDIALVVRRPAPHKYPKGAKLRITADYTVSVGSTQHSFLKGQTLEAGNDQHGLLGTAEEQTPIQVPIPGQNNRPRILLALVPNSILEPIPQESHGQQEQPHEPSDSG